MNTALFFFLYNLHFLDNLAVFVSNEGSIAVVVLAAIFFVLLFIFHKEWKRRRWIARLWEVGIIGASVGITWGIVVILKLLFHEPRPFIALQNVHPLVSETPYTSMPSAHAAFFFALATAIFLYDRRAGIFFYSCAALIAVSRVIVGVHFPADVLVGALLGTGIAWIIHKALSNIRLNFK